MSQSATATFLLPSFDKSANKNKVHDHIDISSDKNPQTLQRREGPLFTAPAIASQGFPAHKDGTYVYCVLVGGHGTLGIGFTSTATIDTSAPNVCPGVRFMNGACLILGTGNFLTGNGVPAGMRRSDYHFGVDGKPNALEITSKAIEVIAIFRISDGRANRSVQFIVDGNEGEIKECEVKDFENECGTDEIFPVISMDKVPEQVTMIPLNEVEFRSPLTDALMKEFVKQETRSKENKGAEAFC